MIRANPRYQSISRTGNKSEGTAMDNRTFSYKAQWKTELKSISLKLELTDLLKSVFVTQFWFDFKLLKDFKG